jgi:RHS repeat-associated protein
LSTHPSSYIVETTLYYNYFRDYDPTMGRYIESDPIGLGGGINPYAYVGGNPILEIDPFGLLGFGVSGSGTVEAGVIVVGAGGTKSIGGGLFLTD